MPSPFPGMDPYLEGPQWTSVHAELSVEIARQLSPRLLPRYVARTNERFVMTVPDTDDEIAVSTAAVYPDAFVAETGIQAKLLRPQFGLAVMPAPLQVATVMPEPVRQYTVEILDVANRRLVTAIEVLSPSNKRGDSREEYVSKRQRILLGSAHLMEVDLLRSGQRVPMQKPLPASPYFVLLSRAEKRPITEVWPIKLKDSLPPVPVPLLKGDDDVPLDLQAALTAVYDTFGYSVTIDYTRPPIPQLAQEDAKWAQVMISAWRQSRTMPE
jgi:hypothetical protein